MQRWPRSGRRFFIGTLTLLTTAAAVSIFASSLALGGWNLLTVLLLVLFAVLFLWVSLSFWLATVGFVQCLLHPPTCTAAPPSRMAPREKLRARSAILMPIYNEDPHRVLAGLRATRESL